MDILAMVRQLAVRNILSSELICNPLQISVQFDDCKVVFKDNVGLRMWAVVNQNLRYEWIEGNTDHCVVEPLGYYALLGFRIGDAVLRQNARGNDQPTVFS